MNYWLVLFIKPETLDYAGPQKWRISKAKYEKIISPEVGIIQFDDAVYRMDEKKIFSIENYNKETTDCFCVCEAHRLKQKDI